NLPVTDLDRAKAFYTEIGFTIDFADHNAARVVVEDGHSYFMILVRDYFQSFTDRPIGDPAETVSAATAIFLDDRSQSTRRSPKASPRAAGRRIPPRTTASCTSVSSPTPTETSSNSATWTR